MIEGQRQAHGRVRLNDAVLRGLDLRLDIADAENAGLGRIDHGRECLAAERADVGDGEGCAGHIIGAELAFAGLGGKPLGFHGQLEQRHLVGVKDRGDDQTARGVAGEAEVDGIEVTNDVLFDDVCIQIRAGLDGLCNGKHDHVVEADLAHGRVKRLEHGAVGLDLGRVEGILLGELRHGGQALRHGLGRGLAHGTPLDILKVGGSGRCCGRCCIRGGCAGGDQLVDIALDDAAVGAGAGGKGRVDIVRDGLGHSARRNGLQLGCGGRRCGSCGRGFFCGGSGCGSRSLCAGLQELIRVAGVADCADVGKARNLVAVLKELCKQRAGSSGFAFELRLVGFVGEQNVAGADGIADILLPLADDAGLDRDALLRHDHSLCAGACGRCCGSGSGSLGGFCCGSCGCSGGCRCVFQRGGILAGVADGADIDQARNLVAVFIEFLKQGAGGGGFAFELRLVRLIGEEDIADVYMVADILLPLANDARFDCNAFLGHQYAFCHKCFTPILISIKIICWPADTSLLPGSTGRCGAW